MNKSLKQLLTFSTIIIILITFFLFTIKQYQTKHASNHQSTPTPIQQDPLIGQSFFTTKTPHTLANTTLQDLNYFEETGDPIQYQNYQYIPTEKMILKYNIHTQQIEKFSNLALTKCKGKIILIDNYLYTSCSNKKDTPFQDSPYQDDAYEIYKINLTTEKIAHIYGKNQGLLNGFNHFLIPDNTNIWVGTFDGVGKIDTTTDQVEFYNDELDPTATSWGVNTILIQTNYVWITVTANSYSRGSINRYNKTTKELTRFGPNEIKLSEFERLDIDPTAIKNTLTGIELLITEKNPQAKQSLCILRSYSNQENIWTTIKTIPYSKCDNFRQSYFTPALQGNNNPKKTNNFSKGRIGLIISPIINNQRYVLTNTTIDTIDNSQEQPKTIFTLPQEILPYYTELDIGVGNSQGTLFYIQPKTMKTIIIDSSCRLDERDSCNKPIIWIMDLEKLQVVRKFTGKQLPIESGWELLGKLSSEEHNNIVTIKKDEKALFTINLSTNQLLEYVE